MPVPRLAVSSLLLFSLVALALPARADDAAAQFNGSANPSGNWTYGARSLMDGSFSKLPTSNFASSGLHQWLSGDGALFEAHCQPVIYEPGVTLPSAALIARTGTGHVPVLRWTAPTTGVYHVSATFDALGSTPPPGISSRTGGQATSLLGKGVAVGDVNGDGFGDVIVGQPLYDDGQTDEGRAVLYLGSATGLATTPAWTHESNQTSAQCGTTLLMADLNKDGYADAIVGTPLWDAGGADAGKVEIFLGGPSGLSTTVWWTATGTAGSELGYSLAVLDLNLDGWPDVVAGAPLGTSFLSLEGRIFAWFGGAGGLGANGTPANADFAVAGGQAGAELGISLATVNHGGSSVDLAASAPLYDGPGGFTDGGGVFIYVATSPSGPAGAAHSYFLNSANGQLGSSLAGGPDLDGNGYGDLLAGAPGYSSGFTNNGLVWYWPGDAGSYLGVPSATYGTQNGQHYGYSLAVGRLHRGGAYSAVIGSISWTSGQSLEGRVEARHAAAGALSSPYWTLESNQAGAELGWSVATGDMNGDGSEDIAVTTPLWNGSLADEGRVSVICDADSPPATSTDVTLAIRRNGTTLVTSTLDQAAGRDTAIAGLELSLAAGDVLDFEAGLLGGANYDAVGFDVLLAPRPDPTTPGGPAFELAGQDFALTAGGPAFEAIAWDPVHQQYASNGGVFDACGNPLSPGPTGAAIAWDLVTGTYWETFHDNAAKKWLFRRYDYQGTLVDTVLQVPEIVLVGGTPDTIEDVRGLALDSAYVYLVDAGPAGLDPRANAWFKLTRAGAVVAGREGADFPVNATGDIVDDVVYAPFSSPTAPGRLLVAIEHVGIQVLDLNGALVDSYLWAAHGLGVGKHPSAFAGLGLDPTTGDLMLADNDRGKFQVWNRLTGSGLHSYYLGVDGSTPVLHAPRHACNFNLPAGVIGPNYCGVVQSALLFGLAYRATDQRVYSVEYADGTLWKFDPRFGTGERVGPTQMISIWGMASGTSPDRLYGFQQGPNRIVAIDPESAVATPLPTTVPFTARDLAFSPATGWLYGVRTNDPTPVLVRFDRTTGAATDVGPTVNVSGLDFDPSLDALVGVSCCSDTIYRIDPATGAASYLTTRLTSAGWEGLAVVPVATGGSVSVEGPASAPEIPARLTAWPNPSLGRVSFSVGGIGPGGATVDVFDICGRRVRRLEGRPTAAGKLELQWDGRDARGGRVGPGVYFARLAGEAREPAVRVVRMR